LRAAASNSCNSYHGIATHFIHSSSLPSLSERLAHIQFKDYASLSDRLSLIDSTIAEFSTGLPTTRPAISGALRNTIDECFDIPPADGGVAAADAPLKILRALDDVAKGHSDESIRSWAEKTIKTMRERSPIAVAVTLQQMRLGSNWSIGQTFQAEHDIAAAFMAHPDFVEGVTARLIERKKERPNWTPNQLEDVTEDMVRSFFRKGLGGGLALLKNGPESEYRDYPFRRLGLPSQREILDVAGHGEGKKMNEEVVQHFVKERNGKVGVREKVEEVLERFEKLKDEEVV
jgi:3-hydroxyisobutyryl-CoA hydrolase